MSETGRWIRPHARFFGEAEVAVEEKGPAAWLAKETSDLLWSLSVMKWGTSDDSLLVIQVLAAGSAGFCHQLEFC